MIAETPGRRRGPGRGGHLDVHARIVTTAVTITASSSGPAGPATCPPRLRQSAPRERAGGRKAPLQSPKLS